MYSLRAKAVNLVTFSDPELNTRHRFAFENTAHTHLASNLDNCKAKSARSSIYSPRPIANNDTVGIES